MSVLPRRSSYRGVRIPVPLRLYSETEPSEIGNCFKENLRGGKVVKNSEIL